MGLRTSLKKVFQLLLIIVFFALSKYILYFHSYIKKTNDYIQTIDYQLSEEVLNKLYKLIELKMEQSSKYGKSKQSITSLIRVQIIKAFYLRTKKDYDRVRWRTEVFVWKYLSYFYLTSEDIKKIHIYQMLYRISKEPNYHKRYVKIYEYSQFYFKKNINELTDNELKELYKIGK